MSRLGDVRRPDPVVLLIDGHEIAAYPGETVAAALLASGLLRFRDDRAGQARGLFCNMGTCSECMAWVEDGRGAGFVRRRTCLVPVAAGMRVVTDEPEADLG